MVCASGRHLHSPCAGKFSPPVGKGRDLRGSCQSTRSCSAPPVPKHLSDTGKKRNHSYSYLQHCCLVYQTSLLLLLRLLPSYVHHSSCPLYLTPQVSHPFLARCQVPVETGQFRDSLRGWSFVFFLPKEGVNIFSFPFWVHLPLVVAR